MNSLATVIGSVFELYIGFILFSKFGNLKYSNKKNLVFILIISLLAVCSSLAFAGSLFLFVGFSTCYFLLALLFKIKFWKKILLTLALIITTALSEMIIVMCVTLGMDIDITTLQNSSVLYLVSVLMANFLAFAVLKPIKKNMFSSHTKLPLWFNLSTAILPFTSIFILILLYRFSFIVDSAAYKICTLIAAILLITSNLLILYVVDKQEKYFRTEERLSFAEAHIKNQIIHYAELYEQQEILKNYKHDNKNRMLSLIGLIKENDNEKALYILEKELDFLNDNRLKTVNTGNPIIDAVIGAKIKLANDKDIKIQTSARLTEEILIDELEIGVLLGNALDNAIEASEKVEKEYRKPIKIEIISVGSHLSLSVSNSVASNVDTGNLQTTKADTENHGYGLDSIKAIAEKYNGAMFITCENNVFEISVNIVNIKHNK